MAIRSAAGRVEPGVPGTQADKCMFCGTPVVNQGEAYYDHLRASKACEAAWRQWREELDKDRPSGG